MVSIDAGIVVSDGDGRNCHPCDNSPPEGTNNQPGGQQPNTGQPNKDQTPTSTPPPVHQSPSSPQSSPSPPPLSPTPSSLGPTPTDSQPPPNVLLALPSSPSDPTDTQLMPDYMHSATLSNGPIPSNSPYAGNADGTIPTASTNNTINTNDYNSTLYGGPEDAPAAKSIPVVGALFCAAIAGFLLLLFRKKLFKTRAFSRRPIFSVKSFTKSSKDQSSTNHRLYDLDDWSVGSCDNKDAQKVTIPPVARISQVSYKRASTTDLASPIRGDGINDMGFCRLSSHNAERSLTSEMAYNSQRHSLNQNPFEGEEEGEFDVLVMPSTPERKVNWEDCMR